MTWRTEEYPWDERYPWEKAAGKGNHRPPWLTIRVWATPDEKQAVDDACRTERSNRMSVWYSKTGGEYDRPWALTRSAFIRGIVGDAVEQIEAAQVDGGKLFAPKAEGRTLGIDLTFCGEYAERLAAAAEVVGDTPAGFVRRVLREWEST